MKKSLLFLMLFFGSVNCMKMQMQELGMGGGVSKKDMVNKPEWEEVQNTESQWTDEDEKKFNEITEKTFGDDVVVRKTIDENEVITRKNFIVDEKTIMDFQPKILRFRDLELHEKLKSL